MDPAPPSMSNIEQEPVYESDSEEEDGQKVVERRWPRSNLKLEKHGFRPVWTSWDGYPGEVPDDIGEYLDDGKCKPAQLIGPLRSIAWLAGLDELVEAIDHPAFVIQDQIELVPYWGAGIEYPVYRHIDEGQIPPRISDLLDYYQPKSTPIAKASTPPAVKTTATSNRLIDLYATSRFTPSSTVKCFKVSWDRNPVRLCNKIQQLASPGLDSSRLWFCGLTLEALESTLAFFIPERNKQNHDNEFGPGFYTTNSLEYSCVYAGTAGAIMVFRDPDLHTTQVWHPSLEEWSSWVARWLKLPIAAANATVPPQYLTADFIKGAIRGKSASPSVLPTQSDDEQLVAVSYHGCEVLSKCLIMIIFVERK